MTKTKRAADLKRGDGVHLFNRTESRVVEKVVDASDVALLEAMVGRWVVAMQDRPSGVSDVDADVEAWRRGEFDA